MNASQHSTGEARRVKALGVGLLLAAASLSSTLVGCSAPPDGGGQEPPTPDVDGNAFLPVDASASVKTAPPLRGGRRAFLHDATDTGASGDQLFAGGDPYSVVLVEMSTQYVVTSETKKERSIWNAQLHDGSIEVGSGNLGGSIKFLTKGDLYVESEHEDEIIPTSPGRTPYPLAFPIVVTTSGGVRAGSVGTAWFCWCDPAPFNPLQNKYYFVLLDNPPSSTIGTLWVGKGDCWGDMSGTCVRQDLNHTNYTTHCIRVVNKAIDRMLISDVAGLQTRVDRAKTRAQTVGLRKK